MEIAKNVQIWSKSDQTRLRKTLHKQTNRQTNRQTDRHYENNGHLAVNQKRPHLNVNTGKNERIPERPVTSILGKFLALRTITVSRSADGWWQRETRSSPQSIDLRLSICTHVAHAHSVRKLYYTVLQKKLHPFKAHTKSARRQTLRVYFATRCGRGRNYDFTWGGWVV